MSEKVAWIETLKDNYGLSHLVFGHDKVCLVE